MNSPALASALPFLLRWEGGYVNHPRDPGGATLVQFDTAVNMGPGRAVRFLPGFESASDDVDYGEAGFMARVPDIGEDAAPDPR